MKPWLLACLILITGGVSPLVAAPPAPSSGLEVSKSESVMTMRVDGELVVDTEGRVTNHQITSEVTPEIRAAIDKSIPQWRFEPVASEDGKAIPFKTLMRITVVARQLPDGNYSAQIENVRFHDGKKPDYRAEAKEKGIEMVVRPRPKYPALMLGNGVNGAALVQILFTPEGDMQDAVVVQSAMFNVRGDSQLLQQAVAQMEREALTSVRRTKVKFGPDIDLSSPSQRSGAVMIKFSMVGKADDGETSRKAGQWRQEQRGPLRAAVWFDDKRDARIGISDMDGSEDLMSRYRPIAKPVSGVPVL